MAKKSAAGAALLVVFMASAVLARSPQSILLPVCEKFARIRDAQSDIMLETSMQLLGCGGMEQRPGRLWYKAPDKIKLEFNNETYFFKGNNIKKTDKEGKAFIVQLLNSPDFSRGFGPQIVLRDFELKTVQDSTLEAILAGTPKPGVMKNVKKVVFYIDTKENLLRKMDLSLNQGLTGKLEIKYKTINGLSVPVSLSGNSALEIKSGMLVGLLFRLRGDAFKINSGLPNKLFDPGF